MGCLTNTMSVGMKHDMSLARDLEWYKNRIFKFFLEFEIYSYQITMHS